MDHYFDPLLLGFRNRLSVYESKIHKKSNRLILASESKSEFDPLARNSRFDILWNFDPYDEKSSKSKSITDVQR